MDKILIHEVGPRDGLQSEKVSVPFDEKIHWIERLLISGIDIIQLGSFVNPEIVPQMADTDELFAYFNANGKKPDGITLSGLVLNEKGLERGMACGVELFCMGVSASDTHSRKNTGMSTAEALGRIISMAKKASSAGYRVQVSVQSAFGCGFEGYVPADKVLGIVKEYINAGIRNISLADTAGHAYPAQVEELYSAIRQLEPSVEMACHFHNTYGLGLANCFSALSNGVTTIEASFGGLGGCPFTKVPAGNVSTEDLVHSIQRMGLREDICLDELIAVARQVSAFFNRDLPGYVLKTGSIVHFGKAGA